MDLIGHTSTETCALYNYIRDNFLDLDDFVFGGDEELSTKCEFGLICHLVKEDTSADNTFCKDSSDEDDVPICMLRKRWLKGDFVLPL